MTNNEQFINDLTSKLYADLSQEDLAMVKQQLYITCSSYNIEKISTELAVWHGQFPQCYTDFMVTKSIEGLSKRTLALYKLRLEHLFKTVYKPVEEMTPTDIKAYLYKFQKERHVSNRTLDSCRSCFSSFFSWSAAEGYIPKNPMVTIEPIKYNRKERGFLSDMELEKVRMACKNTREQAIVEVLYSSACRVSELCGLDIKDINFDTREVQLFGKGAKYRTSYLSARAILALKQYLATRHDDNSALFVTVRSPHARLNKSGVEEIIRDIGKRIDIILFPHLFRHTSATNALRSGMDITQVQTFLGHADVGTTMIYAKVATDSVKANHTKYIH